MYWNVDFQKDIIEVYNNEMCTDEDVKNEIHKRKIANLLIQGKAKGIKELLDSSIVQDGVREIFGGRGEEIITIWKST
jgi:hypothetical protein